VVVKHCDKFLGTIGVADQPRANAREVMNRLRAARIERLVMLTGDNRGVGDAIGERVGVDDVRADLLPEDKVEEIRRLLTQYDRVAMIGDGVNDAPALATATIGVAMGGSGTAVALETADVALMGDDLGKLPFAVELSRKAGLIIRQNVFIALGVIAFLVVAATTGAFGIGWTVLIHEGSTLVVIMNALRLLTVRDVR
jgi:Cd2+/Zn2+-exporting ATPase